MPLRQYTLLQAAAKPGAMEKNVVRANLNKLIVVHRPDTVGLNAWNKQYSK
jgi:hypothetical protein